MNVRRKYAWLVLAGYCSLALAIPALTPVPDRDFPLPRIAPIVLADSSADDAMMAPLRQQASAALNELQKSYARDASNAF